MNCKITEHIYFSEKSLDNIKECISYMKNNNEVLCFELYSDDSKIITNNFKKISNEKIIKKKKY